MALGTVHPDRIVRNVGARPGDWLVLTKPLGIGIITTAIKRGLASAETIARAVTVMATLNRAASEAMVANGGVHAATDVTGFGLLGHLSEMLGAGDVGARVETGAVPVLEEAWDFVARDVVPGSEVLSMIRTRTPSRVSQSANTKPVGPAPTIRTSLFESRDIRECRPLQRRSSRECDTNV